LGNEEYQKGRFEQAIIFYSKALEIKQHEIYFSNRMSDCIVFNDIPLGA